MKEKHKVVSQALALTFYGVMFTYSTEVLARNNKNVVFIMTDDQGYGDFGFNGNENIKTPNVDKLASESYRFTNYHTSTTSAPTRGGVMTGKYNNAVGVWHTIQGREMLDREELTIADLFQDNGYKTGMFGKWHLGDNYPYRPFDRGFDHTLWHKGGGVGQLPDYWGNTYFDDVYFENDKEVKVEGYCTDVFFTAAKEFIRDNKDEQFFCYISTNAPHAPHNVEECYAAPYRGNSEIVSPAFYGMIANVDENVGQLTELLEELGLAENTIVVFTTDNGTAGGANVDRTTGDVLKGYNAGMRGRKGMIYDGGHRVPFLVKIPNEEAKSREIGQLSAYIDIAPTLARLCSLRVPKEIGFDGVDLVPVLNDDNSKIDRYLVVDVQRKEYLRRSAPSCVMYDNWRLVNGQELYDVATDVGQRVDLSQQYPDIVNKLSGYFDQWWNYVEKAGDKMAYIPISVEGEPRVYLNAHDKHSPNGEACVNSQVGIRQGLPPVGSFWAIEVPEDGFYSFKLYRWAEESGLNLSEAAPIGRDNPGGKPFKEGVSIKDITEASIRIGDVEKIIEVENSNEVQYAIIENIKLKKGLNKLFANFNTKSNQSYGAGYVVIEAK